MSTIESIGGKSGNLVW